MQKMDALYYNQYHNDILIFKAFTEVQIPFVDMTLAWLVLSLFSCSGSTVI